MKKGLILYGIAFILDILEILCCALAGKSEIYNIYTKQHRRMSDMPFMPFGEQRVRLAGLSRRSAAATAAIFLCAECAS